MYTAGHVIKLTKKKRQVPTKSGTVNRCSGQLGIEGRVIMPPPLG